MRNVFDQYHQPENRLTHALACCLHGDRALIGPFLRWLGLRNIPPIHRLRIVEQQVPGAEVSGEEDDGRGLPDMCIADRDGWAVLFESKVAAGINPDQLRRHRATARRYGYEGAAIVLLAVDRPASALPAGFTAREWREVYAWFSRCRGDHPWARSFVEYLETFEAKMIARDYSIRGTLTMFSGFHFDQDTPYTYREAKRLIRLLRDELRGRKDLADAGIDAAAAGRSAITGSSGDHVWDYIPLMVAMGGAHTSCPHFTMGIHRDHAVAAVTVPHGVRGGLRSRLTEMGPGGFLDLARDLEKRLRPVVARSKGAKPVLYATQRHYRSQRALPDIDARLDVDLRTAVPGGRGGVKHQPQWLAAVYEVLRHKRANIQLGLDVRFRYDCPVVRSREVLDLFAGAWLAAAPLVRLAMGGESQPELRTRPRA